MNRITNKKRVSGWCIVGSGLFVLIARAVPNIQYHNFFQHCFEFRTLCSWHFVLLSVNRRWNWRKKWSANETSSVPEKIFTINYILLPFAQRNMNTQKQNSSIAHGRMSGGTNTFRNKSYFARHKLIWSCERANAAIKLKRRKICVYGDGEPYCRVWKYKRYTSSNIKYINRYRQRCSCAARLWGRWIFVFFSIVGIRRADRKTSTIFETCYFSTGFFYFCLSSGIYMWQWEIIVGRLWSVGRNALRLMVWIKIWKQNEISASQFSIEKHEKNWPYWGIFGMMNTQQILNELGQHYGTSKQLK